MAFLENELAGVREGINEITHTVFKIKRENSLLACFLIQLLNIFLSAFLSLKIRRGISLLVLKY